MSTATATASRIVIPYGSKAGQEAFAIFCQIAQRLYRNATAAADAFIAAEYPGAETVKAEHTGGTYRRTVRTAAGERRVIVYDYRSKTVWKK